MPLTVAELAGQESPILGAKYISGIVIHVWQASNIL
jgi:hypothetical protein